MAVHKIGQTVEKAAGNRGKGRPKGVPNKITQSARQAFALAFDTMGGAAGLARWAKRNPDEFYKLYARMIPIEHTGADGGPIVHQVWTFGDQQVTF